MATVLFNYSWTLGTDPNVKDTDLDGFTDGFEVNVMNTDPLKNDTDTDGLSDGQEAVYSTSPLLNDTDSDGLQDGEEILTLGTNATNPVCI